MMANLSNLDNFLFQKKSGMLGIDPGAAGSRSKNANHCTMLLTPPPPPGTGKQVSLTHQRTKGTLLRTAKQRSVPKNI